MSTLVDWVRQQLDTDERVARARRDTLQGQATRTVAAHRAILDYALGHMATVDGEWGCCHTEDRIERGVCAEQDPNQDVAIRAIAAIYADRLGYTEAIGGEQ